MVVKDDLAGWLEKSLQFFVHSSIFDQFIKAPVPANVHGLHHVTDDTTQTLLSVATRYAGVKKQFDLDPEGILLAKEIATNMLDTTIDKERLVVAWNGCTDSSVYQGWLEKAKQAGYAAAYTVAMEDQNFFGAACRVISEVTRNSLNETTTWNNGLSINQATERFSAINWLQCSLSSVLVTATSSTGVTLSVKLLRRPTPLRSRWTLEPRGISTSRTSRRHSIWRFLSSLRPL
jgi:hypothetical protein